MHVIHMDSVSGCVLMATEVVRVCYIGCEGVQMCYRGCEGVLWL